MSGWRVVLRAALRLAGPDNNEFALPALVVAAWGLDRERFGLKGYALLHPDSNRVVVEVVKACRPFLERTRPGHYRVSAAGLAEAARGAGRVTR